MFKFQNLSSNTYPHSFINILKLVEKNNKAKIYDDDEEEEKEGPPLKGARDQTVGQEYEPQPRLILSIYGIDWRLIDH